MNFIDKHVGGRLVRSAFWAAFALTTVMALIPKPPAIPVGYSDKVQHGLAFATLGILGSLAFPRVSSVRLIGLLSLFGALIEVAQGTSIIHRDCDPLDWVADTVACIIAVVAIRRLRRAKS